MFATRIRARTRARGSSRRRHRPAGGRTPWGLAFASRAWAAGGDALRHGPTRRAPRRAPSRRAAATEHGPRRQDGGGPPTCRVNTGISKVASTAVPGTRTRSLHRTSVSSRAPPEPLTGPSAGRMNRTGIRRRRPSSAISSAPTTSSSDHAVSVLVDDSLPSCTVVVRSQASDNCAPREVLTALPSTTTPATSPPGGTGKFCSSSFTSPAAKRRRSCPTPKGVSAPGRPRLLFFGEPKPLPRLGVAPIDRAR